MSHMGDPSTLIDMTAVMSLFKAEDNQNSDTDEEEGDKGRGDERPEKMGPGNIGPAKKETVKTSVYQKKEKKKTEIWDEEEVETTSKEDTVDPREEPQYDIRYKQQVGTEDLYLGMSGKDPTTACCEELSITIKLPDTKRTEMNLNVEDKFLDCRCPRFKLQLPLPHPVDSKNGRAKWDPEESTLTVTLPIKREYDFINFA